jgi:uncharacterized protein DUF4214
MTNRWLTLSRRILPVAMILTISGAAAAQSTRVQAQPTPRGVATGHEPTQIRVYYDDANGRVVPLRAGESLPLYGRQEIQLWLEAWDKHGHQVPQEGLQYQVVTDNHCGGRYTIRALTPHRFSVRVLRNDAFECELYARLVSPRQLEVPLRVAWGFTGGNANYGRSEAEYVVERLYQALLQREPDREGFYNYVQAVDAGRAADVVRSLFESAEFRSAHNGWSRSRLLDSLYRGLLGRPADATAARAYENRLADPNDRVRVVMEMLASREFTDLLNRNAVAADACASGGPSAPCEVRVYYERGDGRTAALGANERLDLANGGQAQIWLETVDQYGRQYTGTDSRFRILAGNDCDALDVHPLSAYRYTLRPISGDAGRCQLVVRLDAPRRIDRAVDVQWDGSGYGYGGYYGGSQIYNREDAEYIVDRLYRTLAGRPASSYEYNAAVTQVQNGGVRALVDALTASPEFVADQRRMSSDDLIESLYRGLVQQTPANTDVYRSSDGRMDYLAVILQLLSSPEFRALLARNR